jgi:hypothetical protein
MLCRECKHEAQHYINGRAGAQMKMQAEASGTGQLTAAEAMHQLMAVPPEAVVHIHTDGDQRDGPYWTIRAEWDREQMPAPAPESNIRAKYRGQGHEIRLGDSERRDIQVPITGDGGFTPVPTTGPITQQNERHYGQRGDDYFGIGGVGVGLGE